MKPKLLRAGAWTAVIAAVILAACGGGSSSNSPSASPTAMAGASGVITGFGSVVVNGHEFATDMHTQVLDGDNDDAAASTASLQVGMTVDVDASNGTATMLRFTSAVRGEVDSIDAMGNTLTVLGQTVQITSGTSFSGNVGNSASAASIMQMSDIHQGDYVVVFGYLECTGSAGCPGATTLVATLVNEPSSIGKYRVQGYVTNYSTGMGMNTFTINGLTVDVATSGASPTNCNTMNCAFSNGNFVSIRSTTAPSSTGGALTLTANDVKLRPVAPTFAAGATITIEGPVTQLSGTSFVVRGISVDGSGIPTMLAGLQNNQIVEVTGTITSSGTLMATSIDVERAATLALMGSLDSVSSMGFSVLGQSFSVTNSTRFVDWATDVRPFNSTNFATVLMMGDQIIVSGYPSGSGNVATRVERIRKPSSPQAAAAGIVASDNAPTDTMMTVAGITVTLSSSTQLFYSGAGSSPTLAGFFAAITPGSSIALAFGPPGSSTGTINAADAALLRLGTHWED
ncbi:MAG TPA: DUF5666 domain-containing protein [Burkholderiaceae bacterium]